MGSVGLILRCPRFVSKDLVTMGFSVGFEEEAMRRTVCLH